jgi:hypothetical protein
MLARIAQWQPDQGTAAAARAVGALALSALAVIHVVDLPGTLGPDRLVGIGYLGIIAAAIVTGGVLIARSHWLADNAGRPLQAQTPLDTGLIAAFDVPPYVNSADQSGAVPFLDIANKYVLAGAQYNPQVLAGLSAAQIAGQLSDPASPVAQAIDGSAQVIVAAIDQVLHDKTSPS